MAAIIHEAYCQEPLQVVWPKGGIHAEGQQCGEVPWQPVDPDLPNSRTTRRGDLKLRVEKHKSAQTLPGLRRRHEAKKVSISTFVETPNMPQLWIGTAEALERPWTRRKGIDAIVFISSSRNSIEVNNDTTALQVSFRNNAGPSGWKEFLASMPEAVKFIHYHYTHKKHNVLVASDDPLGTNMTRQVSLLAAYLLLKERIPLKTSLRKIQERCYRYNYQQALAKSEWIKVCCLSISNRTWQLQ